MNPANRACRHLVPNGGVLTAAQKQQALNQLLKFSACMRAHGLANFPDPVESNGGVGLTLNPKTTGLNPRSPVFQAAQRACRKDMPGLAGSQKVARSAPRGRVSRRLAAAARTAVDSRQRV
jgi:hypothetical protein